MKRALVYFIAFLLLYGVFIALHFPRATDPPLGGKDSAELIRFYADAYAKESKSWTGPNYVVSAQAADDGYGFTDAVKQFIEKYNLKDAKALDIGSGRGQLQDLVADYTGLDIAATAGRLYHKPFVAGSATALPFPDAHFDTAWSINALEHIPNPEQALSEMRRVVKSGGLLFIIAAWRVPTWAADGYDMRPYSDFGMWGKVVKASVPVRASAPYRYSYLAPIRFLRLMAPAPTSLHYVRLTPNYHAYWNDSDAVNSIDRYEAVRWFRSRGDECLSCNGAFDGIVELHASPMVIRVRR
jgi:SAM-dependent methyltransferase